MQPYSKAPDFFFSFFWKGTKAPDFIITEAYSNGLKEQPSNSASIKHFRDKDQYKHPFLHSKLANAAQNMNWLIEYVKQTILQNNSRPCFYYTKRGECTKRASVLSTFDDSQEEKGKEERQELEEAPNRYPNPSRHWKPWSKNLTISVSSFESTQSPPPRTVQNGKRTMGMLLIKPIAREGD